MPGFDITDFIEDAGTALSEGFGKLKKGVEESEIGQAIDKVIDGGTQHFKRIALRSYPTGGEIRFRYPERRDPDVRSRWDLGVAFSGGGTRSMSLSVGQMRALRQIDRLDLKIRYIGAISGGSWFAVPWTYLPNRVSDTAWLGRHHRPESLTRAMVRSVSSAHGHGIATRSLVRSEIVLQGLADLVPTNLWAAFGLDEVDEIYGRLLEGVFLRDIGLAGERYMGWKRDRDVRSFLERHRKAAILPWLGERDFCWVEKDRPYLCVNGAMNQDWIKLADGSSHDGVVQASIFAFEHVEFTPLYSGIHRIGRSKLRGKTGGGYIDNVGWDSWAPDPRENDWFVVIPGLKLHRLSLKDVMGTSGAAPAHVAHLLLNNPLLKWLDMFPRYRVWPVAFDNTARTEERAFGDGGYVDNYGFIPLLKRGVSNIIVCINTDTPIGEDRTWPGGVKLDLGISASFGVEPPVSFGEKITSPTVLLDPDRFPNAGAGDGKVFAGGYDRLVQGLLRTCRLANARPVQGATGPIGRMTDRTLARLDIPASERAAFRGLVRGPIYHVDDYVTVENDYFGVPGGQQVRILWVYNERSQAWRERLPRDVDAFIGKGALEKFPHIGTFAPKIGNLTRMGENYEQHKRDTHWLDALVKTADDALESLEIIDLAPEQANLMMNLSAWSMLQLRPVIEGELLPRARPAGADPIPASLSAVLQATGGRSFVDAAARARQSAPRDFPAAAATSLDALARFLSR